MSETPLQPEEMRGWAVPVTRQLAEACLAGLERGDGFGIVARGLKEAIGLDPRKSAGALPAAAGAVMAHVDGQLADRLNRFRTAETAATLFLQLAQENVQAMPGPTDPLDEWRRQMAAATDSPKTFTRALASAMLWAGRVTVRATAERFPEWPGVGDAIELVLKRSDETITKQLQREWRRRVPRKSNRKVDLVFDPSELLQVPNILQHGTRNLGLVLSGAGDWQTDPMGGKKLALVNGHPIGFIEIGDGGEDEAGRIIDKLGPRALKTMIAVSKLLYEKTRGYPVNQAATLTIREVALARGEKPDKSRKVDPEVLRGIAHDLRACTRLFVWGAGGAYDAKKRAAPEGWLSPLLLITAIKVSQKMLDGDELPYTFDAMLGRPWAEAIKDRFDVMQVAPGFMRLNPTRDEHAMRLAWYYLTTFRYRMQKAPRMPPVKIERLCADARISIDRNNLGRFVRRLEDWHARLRKEEIIGDYGRAPDLPIDTTQPSRFVAETAYWAEPPGAILEAYREQREKALARAGAVSRPPRQSRSAGGRG